MKDYYETLTGYVLEEEAARIRLAYAACALEDLGYDTDLAEKYLRRIEERYPQDVKDAIIEYLDAKNDLGKF
jgi:hypothetical protein